VALVYWISNIAAGLAAACWCLNIVRTDFCGLYQAAGAVIAIDLILCILVSLAYLRKSKRPRPAPAAPGVVAPNTAVPVAGPAQGPAQHQSFPLNQIAAKQLVPGDQGAVVPAPAHPNTAHWVAAHANALQQQPAVPPNPAQQTSTNRVNHAHIDPTHYAQSQTRLRPQPIFSAGSSSSTLQPSLISKTSVTPLM